MEFVNKYYRSCVVCSFRDLLICDCLMLRNEVRGLYLCRYVNTVTSYDDCGCVTPGMSSLSVKLEMIASSRRIVFYSHTKFVCAEAR